MFRITIGFILVLTSSFFAEGQDRRQEPEFYKIIEQKDAEFEKKIKKQGSSEGLEYNPYLRWKNFWLPRIGEHGKFSDAEKAIDASVKSLFNDETSCASDANWTEVGPISFPSTGNFQRGVGRADWIKLHPNYNNLNNFTVFAGGRCGLWTSVDNGLNWNQMGSDKFSSWGTSDVAVKPIAGSPDWLLTNTGTSLRDVSGLSQRMNSNSIGLRRSTDGGATWSVINIESVPWTIQNRRKVSELMVDPSNPDRVYATVNYFDWSPSTLHTGHPTIGTSGNSDDHWHGQVFVSDDFGLTWTKVFQGEYIADFEFKPGDPTTFYVAGHALYRGQRSGTSYTFTPLTQNLPNLSFLLSSGTGHAELMEVEVSANNPDAVYVQAIGGPSIAYNGLWYSSNNGNSFTKRVDPASWQGNQAARIGWVGVNHIRFDLEVSEQDENRIFMVGLNSIYSTDGGINWNQVANVHADVNDLEISNDDEIFMANDGGIYRSLDNGATYIPTADDLSIGEVYDIGMSIRTDPTVPDIIEAGFLDVTCMTYNSFGWSQPSNVYGDGMTCVVDYADPSIVYNSSQFGSIRRSTNFGQSFSGYNFGSGGNWVTPYLLDPNDHNLIVIGKRYVTTHHAITGVTQTFPVSSNVPASRYISAINVARGNSDVMYAAFPVGNANSTMSQWWNDPNMFMEDQVFITQDGGSSWTDITPHLVGFHAWVTSVEIHPVNPDVAWITYAHYKNGRRVMMTADGGTTWTDYSTGLPNMPVNDIVVNPLGNCNFLYVATDAGIYYRKDKMAQWECYDRGLPNMPVVDLELDPYAELLRCATFGRGVWQSPTHPSDYHKLTTNFEYEINCSTGIVGVREIASNPSGSYDKYTLWLNNPADPNNLTTTGDIKVESIAFWGYNNDANGFHLFSTPLDKTGDYYIVRGVWGDCNAWQQQTMHSIKLVPQPLVSTFTYTINCNAAGLPILSVTGDLQPANSNPFYQFDLYEYGVVGQATSGVKKSSVASWQQLGFPGAYVYQTGPLAFTYPLNPAKYYYIKHGVWNACTPWRETIIKDINTLPCPVLQKKRRE
jgi:photosystem II stability/assembly factor-like uncharacterized protein